MPVLPALVLMAQVTHWAAPLTGVAQTLRALSPPVPTRPAVEVADTFKLLALETVTHFPPETAVRAKMTAHVAVVIRFIA
jgi:hypothetical protein